MRKFTYFKTMLLAVMLLVGSGSAWGQMLQQNFSSSSTMSDYVNSTSPSNGQWNTISTSGAGTVLSITSGALQFARSNNVGTFSRTTDFSPTPTSLIYKFDLTVSGNSVAQTTAAVWQVGAGFGTANSAEVIANVHSRIGLNWTTTSGQFSIRDIGASSNSANFSGTQTVTWVINNSGSSLSYRAPDGTEESVGDDKADLWVGTTKALNEIAATTSTQILTDLKFAITAGTGIVAIDNILIDPIPLTPNSNAATSVTSNGFTANWSTVSGATGYRLDVATDNAFTSIVSGYNNLYVSGQSSNSQAVTGLSASTTYYYRVRAASQYSVSEFAGASSSIQNLTTSVGSSPTITVTPTSLTDFSYTVGSGPSISQSYNLSGSNLTGFPDNITITGSTNYEVSTDNTNFSNSVIIAYSSATLSSTPVYIRLKSGLSAGNYNSESITNSGGGATDVNVTCNGSVTIPVYYFKSKTTGNWSSPSTWESSSDNSTWSDATRTPTNLDHTITILNGHTVTVDAAVTADEIVVANGGILKANSSLTVNDGMGDDIIIQSGGTLKYSASSSYAGFTGTAPTISNETGGTILSTTTGIINNIQNTNYIYKNASILEYNGTNAPAVNGITFFPNADESTIPILRFTSSISTNIGGANPTTINGNVEIMPGVNITLASTGLKTIRNGVYLFGASSLTVNTKLTCASLEADAGSTLTVSAGKQLTVSGMLTNNGTLNLLSTAADGTATLLTPGAVSGSGTANVNQALTYRTWYMSSPVASASPTGMAVIRSYDEATNLWSIDNSPMVVGKGYSVTPPNDGTNNILFTGGTLNTGEKAITLDKKGSTSQAGYNSVGNPYPSYIDWNTVVTKNAAILETGTMWYRTKIDATTYKFYTVDASGVVAPSGSTATAYIPPMQGFWVKTNTDGSTLYFEDNMRSHAGTTENPSPNPLKAPAAKKSELSLLRLQVSNGINSDEAVIYSYASATNGYDFYDSPKMMNNDAAIPEIFTTLNNQPVAINVMNSIPLDTKIGLGFVPGNATSFSIRANEISNLPSGVKVILKDNANNGTETDLTDGVTTYGFSPATITGDRFSLIFRSAGSVSGIENPADLKMLVYSNAKNQLTVLYSDAINDATTVSVYNAVGQQFISRQLTGTSTVLNGIFPAGVYVVKVNNVIRKVIVE